MLFHTVMTNVGLYGDLIGYLHKRWTMWSEELEEKDLPPDLTPKSQKLFWMIWRVKVAGQDNLSDAFSVIAVPCMVSLVAALNPGATQNYVIPGLWGRFGCMVGFRIVCALLCRHLFAKKVEALQRELEIWSVEGDRGVDGVHGQHGLGIRCDVRYHV